MTYNQDSYWEKIAGKLHGELSSEEEAEFSKIMSASDNLHEFDKTRQLHDNLVNTGYIPANGKVKSWTNVENGIKIYQLRWIKEVLKYTAIISVAFFAGILLKSNEPTNKGNRFSEITVPYGQMSQLTLSDGTKIWLNSGTTLQFPERYAENSRSVFIEGEAYFEVAKIPGTTFMVNSADIKVEVLGTSFNLCAYKEDNSSSVTLIEGKIEIQDSSGKIIKHLNPGQMVIKNKNETNLEVEDVETGFYAAWREGEIYFDDEPLDQIAVKVERWFNVEITFADENLKSHRFTGTILKNKPVDQIMQALELLSPIRFKHQINANGKDKITIYKRI